MVDVQVSALGSFKEQAFAGFDGLMADDGGVGDVRCQDGCGFQHLGDGFLNRHFLYTSGE